MIRGMLERRRAGQGSHRLGRRIEQRKINENEIHHSLRWTPVDDFQRNNQPKIGVCNTGEYGGEVQRAGGAGKCGVIVFGGGEVQREVEN